LPVTVVEAPSRKKRFGPMMSVNHYSSVSSGWGNGSQDAITFTVDQSVWLAGIGMYGYSGGGGVGEQNVSFSLCEGDSSTAIASATGYVTQASCVCLCLCLC
jgi:hypothetical protein